MIDGVPVDVIQGEHDFGTHRFMQNGVPTMADQKSILRFYIGQKDHLIRRELATHSISVEPPPFQTLLEHTDINTDPHFAPGTFDHAAG